MGIDLEFLCAWSQLDITSKQELINSLSTKFEYGFSFILKYELFKYRRKEKFYYADWTVHEYDTFCYARNPCDSNEELLEIKRIKVGYACSYFTIRCGDKTSIEENGEYYTKYVDYEESIYKVTGSLDAESSDLELLKEMIGNDIVEKIKTLN